MTLNEAIALQSECEKMFPFLENPEISMALTGKLKLTWNDGFVTFDVYDGAVIYVNYIGYKDDFEDICERIEEVVMHTDNNIKLHNLLWSYENRRELEEDNYPCNGHDCYDRGNYHASCRQCPLHK